MANNFPSQLNTHKKDWANETPVADTLPEELNDHAAAIEELEKKVGVDGSDATTSHDYKLSGVANGDKAASLTGEEQLENKTLTSPAINTPTIEGGTHDDGTFDNPTLTGGVEIDLGGDAAGDIYYRDASGNLTRLPKGTNGQRLTLVSGLPAWQDPATAGFAIETTAGATHSLTTNGSQKVVVWAKGNASGDGTAKTTTLKYNAVTKDTVSHITNTGGSVPFSLMYTETPAAGTHNITVETSGSGVSNVVIMVMKIDL